MSLSNGGIQLFKEITSYDGIYVACGATDLRKSIDGLAVIVQQEFNLDPFGNFLFLFCNRERNRLKCLNWDKNGFVLYCKRLDGTGARFKWPKDSIQVRNITIKQLQLLMDGMIIDPAKGFGEITARQYF